MCNNMTHHTKDIMLDVNNITASIRKQFIDF